MIQSNSIPVNINIANFSWDGKVHTGTQHVQFPKAFTNPPMVQVAISGWNTGSLSYFGGGGSNVQSFYLEAQNVSPNGFDIAFNLKTNKLEGPPPYTFPVKLFVTWTAYNEVTIGS